MYRPGGQPAPDPADPWGEDDGMSFRRPPSRSQQWPEPYDWPDMSGPQRPAPFRRDSFGGAQGWAAEPPEPSADWSQDQLTIAYGSRQPFRSPPGQSWQSPSAGAPTAYPGPQPFYDDQFPPFDPEQEPPMPPRRGKKGLLVVLAALLLLGAVGGGAAFLFLRSRPVITVTSKYTVGSTPAGAATTTLQVSGSQFAAHSAVSFLLDGQPEPGHQIFQSDASGALSGDLTVTADWAPGQHTLTAKDASGNTTFQGKPIVIVEAGEANTPGPKGAPADDTPSFTLNLIVHSHDKDTGQNSTYSYTLVVTGQPDPAGGKVCSPQIDTGKPQTMKGTASRVRYTATYTPTCSGTYKGGKITYTQTFSNVKFVYSNGLTCTATAAFVNQELDGSFTSPTAASGTLSSGPFTIACNNGRSVAFQGTDGTWTGTLSS
jgi:hypothetical protein